MKTIINKNVVTDFNPETTSLIVDNEFIAPARISLFRDEPDRVVNDGLQYGPVCRGCNIVTPLTLVCDQC